MFRLLLAQWFFFWAATVVAQDPVKVAPKNYKVLVENVEKATAHSGELSRTDYFVSGAQNVRLFLRRVASGSTQGLPILLIHGGSPGSEVIFDLPVPGYSLAADLARMGLDVFLMDARGWGQSSPSTSESPGSSNEVVTDIGTVVDDVIRTFRESCCSDTRRVVSGRPCTQPSTPTR